MGRLGSQLRVTDLDSNPARSWSIRVWKECTRDRDRGNGASFLLPAQGDRTCRGASSTWSGVQESELESEFEQELELEGKGFLGEVVGGLLGEMMAELEFKGEGELEGEGFLGDVVGGLLGESELEGEQFFGNVFNKIAPFLKKAAKVAAPMVGTAILGSAGGMLGKLAANALGEGEFEFESGLELEFEFDGEFEFEGESGSRVRDRNTPGDRARSARRDDGGSGVQCLGRG